MGMTDKKWIEETLQQAQMVPFAQQRSKALDGMKEGSGLKDEEWAIFTSMFEFAYAAGVRDTLAHCPMIKTLLARAMQADGAELRVATEREKAEVVSRRESDFDEAECDKMGV